MVDTGATGSIRKCQGVALPHLGDTEGFVQDGKDLLYRVPTSSGNHGKPGKLQKKFHALKNHGV